MTVQSTQLFDAERFAGHSQAAIAVAAADHTRTKSDDVQGTQPDEMLDGQPLPSRIGKYEVRRLLGRGGQAQAILAFDPDLQRHVVLKRYHAVRSVRERDVVLNEGRALAQVRSPFVAQCFGADRHDEVPYLVLEHVSGRSLSEVIRTESLSPSRIAELAAGIAEGVAAIHDVGLLHRDLKPANVMVDESGQPRIVDFGLAATLGSDDLKRISGTPAYMAPEQARGDSACLSPATDVFGVGAILHELLTGRAPYVGTSQRDIWQQAQQGAIAPLDHGVAPSLQPLAAICLSCLHAEPGKRLASARILRDALRQTTQPQRRGLELNWRWGRFHFRLALGLSVTAVLSLLLAVTVSRRLAPDGLSGLEVAIGPVAEARVDAPRPAAMEASLAQTEAAPEAALFHTQHVPSPQRKAMTNPPVSEASASLELLSVRFAEDGVGVVPPGTRLTARASSRSTAYFHIWHDNQVDHVAQLLPNQEDRESRVEAGKMRDFSLQLPDSDDLATREMPDASAPEAVLHVLITSRSPAPLATPHVGERVLARTPAERQKWLEDLERQRSQNADETSSYLTFPIRRVRRP